MASGSSLLAVIAARAHDGPESGNATPDTRNGRPCLDFPMGVDRYATFSFVIPSAYTANAPITAKIGWSGTTDTGTNALWSGAFRAFIDDTTDTDTFTFTTAVTGAKTAGSGSPGKINYDTLAFTSAHFGLMSAGQMCVFQIGRLATQTGTDTLSGDAELYTLEILET